MPSGRRPCLHRSRARSTRDRVPGRFGHQRSRHASRTRAPGASSTASRRPASGSRRDVAVRAGDPETPGITARRPRTHTTKPRRVRRRRCAPQQDAPEPPRPQPTVQRRGPVRARAAAGRRRPRRADRAARPAERVRHARTDVASGIPRHPTPVEGRRGTSSGSPGGRAVIGFAGGWLSVGRGHRGATVGGDAGVPRIQSEYGPPLR